MFHNYWTETPSNPPVSVWMPPHADCNISGVKRRPCILVHGAEAQLQTSNIKKLSLQSGDHFCGMGMLCAHRETGGKNAEPVILKHCWSCHSITSIQKEEEDQVTICVWYRILPIFTKSAHYAQVRAARPWNTSGLFTPIISFMVTKSPPQKVKFACLNASKLSLITPTVRFP